MAIQSRFLTLLLVVFCLFVFENTQAQSAENPETASTESDASSTPSPSVAPTPPKSPQESFSAGLLAYQNKKYEEAKGLFINALKSDPANAAVLTNLGLVYYQLNKKPLAMAYFRKALNYEPGFDSARNGLRFTVSQLEVKEIPHQIENYEIIRDMFLLPVSEYSYFWLLAALVFLFGWSLLRYLGQRRKAFDEELPLPGFPWVPSVALFLSLIVLTLGVLKIYDSQIPRATIIEDKVSVQSAPGDKQLQLFELFGGLEVIVRHQMDDWVQVTYPGGMTGWIKKNQLLLTSGRISW